MFKTQLKKSVFMIEIMLRLEFFKHLKGIKMCFTTTKTKCLKNEIRFTIKLFRHHKGTNRCLKHNSNRF